MTTIKSFEKRLQNIPEPDLERLWSDVRCMVFRQFPFERLSALRAFVAEKNATGEPLTDEEMATVLGIPQAELQARWKAARDAVFSQYSSEDADMPRTDPPPERAPSRAAEPTSQATNTVAPASDSTANRGDGTGSDAPPPRPKKSPRSKSTS